jgi:dihydroorotate dehydrogenase (fumarate)
MDQSGVPDNGRTPSASDVSWHRLVAVAILLLLSVLAVPAPAHAADGRAVFSADPATKAGRDGRQRFAYQLKPGQKVTDNVEVANRGSAPLTLRVYATDAYNSPDGAFALLTSKQAPAGVGTWADFGQRCKPATGPACVIPSWATVTLKPGTRAVIPFTLTVPADARPGDHAAGLIASLVAGKGQVSVESRVITRMYVRVAGPLQPVISIGGLKTSLAGGVGLTGHALGITYTLTNTGNVALRGHVDVWVDGPFGNQVASAPTVTTPELLPGQSRTLSARLPGVSQEGLLSANVRLRPFVDAKALAPGHLADTQRDASIAAVPWLLVVILALALAGLWWGRKQGGLRRVRQGAEIEAALQAGRDEARRELAAHDGAGV